MPGWISERAEKTKKFAVLPSGWNWIGAPLRRNNSSANSTLSLLLLTQAATKRSFRQSSSRLLLLPLRETNASTRCKHGHERAVPLPLKKRPTCSVLRRCLILLIPTAFFALLYGTRRFRRKSQWLYSED